jgi:hypothetical protein
MVHAMLRYAPSRAPWRASAEWDTVHVGCKREAGVKKHPNLPLPIRDPGPGTGHAGSRTAGGFRQTHVTHVAP